MTPPISRPGTVELLFTTAQRLGLLPEWVTPRGLFVISTAAGEQYINHERSSLNSHVSVSLTRNKYHTRLALERHNMPNIPFSRVKTVGEAKEFLATHSTIIAKPLRGSGSKGIQVIRSDKQLDTLVVSEYILERYTPGREMRYLILQGRVIAVHESKYGKSVASDRELERISYDTELWDPILVSQSLKIARVLGLSFGAVDYIIDDSNQAHVLEVNSCPGFKWFHAPSEGPAVDVATMFLHATINSNLGTKQPVLT